MRRPPRGCGHAVVMRYDPVRGIDRLTQQLTGALRSQSTSIPMDACRRGGIVFVNFDLPRADPSSIEVQVEQNALTVRAERFFEPVGELGAQQEPAMRGALSVGAAGSCTKYSHTHAAMACA